MHYIKDLREGEMVSEVYFCRKKTVAQSKTGKTYYSLMLQDKTGTVDGKIWDLNNAIGHFEDMDYIRLDAQVTSFNNALQLNIRRVRVAEETEFDVADYMPCTEKNTDEMYGRLLSLCASVQNEHLRTLLKRFFEEDADFAARFKRHSAAKTMHHAFIGGLLEHSLSVAEICDFMAGHYPLLNRDLLVTAALFHDIGKLDEISSFPENDYTDEGQLVGHIVMGTMMLDAKIREIPGFPKKLADELKHCILAHHGELEFGSPKKPALIEAVALAHADNMDAKVQGFVEVLKNNENSHGWLGFNRMFDSNIRPTES